MTKIPWVHLCLLPHNHSSISLHNPLSTVRRLCLHWLWFSSVLEPKGLGEIATCVHANAAQDHDWLNVCLCLHAWHACLCLR